MASLVYGKDLGNLIYIVPQDNYNDPVGSLELPNKLILTATESFSREDTAVASSFPVSNNTSHGDHYRYNGSTVTFKGVLSPQSITLLQAITGERLPPIQDYITRVKEVMRMLVKKDSNGRDTITSPLVNIHIPNDNSLFNCVITGFKISRDVKVSDGYYVEVTVKELLIANAQYSVKPKSDLVTSTSNNGTDAPVDKSGESKIAEKGYGLNRWG